MENTNGCYREKRPEVRYYSSTSEFRYLIGEVRESGESTLHVIVERRRRRLARPRNAVKTASILAFAHFRLAASLARVQGEFWSVEKRKASGHRRPRSSARSVWKFAIQ